MQFREYILAVMSHNMIAGDNLFLFFLRQSALGI